MCWFATEAVLWFLRSFGDLQRTISGVLPDTQLIVRPMSRCQLTGDRFASHRPEIVQREKDCLNIRYGCLDKSGKNIKTWLR